MKNIKILAFSGSIRKDSFNKKLIPHLADGAKSKGLEVTVVDLKEYPLPLYDGDLEAEQGIPENAMKLKELFKSHQGFLIACPEYNSSITPLLKNTLDWVSRPVQGEKTLEAFQGKFVGLASASPGALGGLRGLVTVRSMLGNIGSHVIPTQMAISKAHEAFDSNGKLKDEKSLKGIEMVGADLAELVSKVHAS